MSKETQFKPGQSGNPKGRPRGSKNKLSQMYIGDLYELWQEKGKDALELLMDTDVSTFCRIIASLVPKDIDIHADIEARVTNPITVKFIESDKGKDEPVALQSVG